MQEISSIYYNNRHFVVVVVFFQVPFFKKNKDKQTNKEVSNKQTNKQRYIHGNLKYKCLKNV